MSDMQQQRDIARRLEQTQVIERPGGVTGFTTFYDSGTFTPVFKGNGTAGTWAYSVQSGYWERVGRRVSFNLNVGASSRSVAPTGTAIIDGLPFTSLATANSHSAVVIDTMNALTLSATIVQLTARIPPNTTFIELIEVLGTAPTVAGGLAATGLGTTPFFRIAGSYLVA
jgi:hypothetical protein